MIFLVLNMLVGGFNTNNCVIFYLFFCIIVRIIKKLLRYPDGLSLILSKASVKFVTSTVKKMHPCKI